jgi:hypothetical protein
MNIAFTLHQFTVPRTLFPQSLRFWKSVLLKHTRTPSRLRFLSTMSLSSPVPIALCGKSQVMATNFSSSMEKEGYEGLSFPFLFLSPISHSNKQAIHKNNHRLQSCSQICHKPVVHTCNDIDSAKSTLPSLLSSSSGPVAVVIGKGFYESEMKEIIEHCKSETSSAKTVWLLPDDDKFSAYMKLKAVASAGTMLPGMIAERAAAALRENGVVAGGSLEGVKSGVHGF